MATRLKRKRDDADAARPGDSASPDYFDAVRKAQRRATTSSVIDKKVARGKNRARIDRVTETLSPRRIRKQFLELERRLGITRVGQISLVGFIGAWLLARIVAGTAMYILAYGALLLLVGALIIAPRNLRLTGDRAGLFPRATEGDRLEVEVHLTAEKRVSTFVLEERLPERLGSSVRVPIARLASGSEVSHRYGLRANRRGVYQVGPLVAIAGDPLGLVQRETIVAEPFELLVHPRIQLVSDRPLTRQYEDPPIRPPVSKPWPSGLEFYGMREYKPGDDLRRIVWRASARTGKIMVREAEQGITDHITIMIDTDRGSHSRDGEISESFEMGIRAAASLGVRHLREGYEMKIETNGGPLTRPLRGSGSQIQLLDGLTRLDLDRAPLTQMIMRMVTQPGRDAHNILITPHLGPTEAAQLKLMLNKGVSILVVALLWDQENSDTMNVAASLGCQVVGVGPGSDLSTALAHSMGAGNRL